MPLESSNWEPRLELGGLIDRLFRRSPFLPLLLLLERRASLDSATFDRGGVDIGGGVDIFSHSLKNKKILARVQLKLLFFEKHDDAVLIFLFLAHCFNTIHHYL